jgi:hypothetical protein
LQPTVGNLILGFTNVRDGGNYTQSRDMNERNRIQLQVNVGIIYVDKGPGTRESNRKVGIFGTAI